MTVKDDGGQLSAQVPAENADTESGISLRDWFAIKAQKTTCFVVECDKSIVDDLQAVIKSTGGKVVK